MAKVRKKTVKRMPKNTTKATAFSNFGRPTKYEPEFCQRVIDFMALGYSKEAVAGELEIDKTTLYQWEKAHEDFSNALKRGVELSRKFWEKTAIDNIVYNQKGKKADAVLWIFNMKNRFGWTDKKEIELGEKTQKKFSFALDISPDIIDEEPEPVEDEKE